jgi:hypothetical protein
MKEQTAEATERLEKLLAITEPDEWTRGSIEHQRDRIKYLEKLLRK